MTFTAQAGVGVRASDGKLMFRYTKAANNVANIATPVFLNDRVFFTSGYGAGGGMLALSVKDGACGIFGWFSDARAVASRSNLTRRSASLANASGRIFRATSRPTDVS